MNYYVKFTPENLTGTIEDIFLLFFPNDQLKAWNVGNQCHFEINYIVNEQGIFVEAISYWQKEIQGVFIETVNYWQKEIRITEDRKELEDEIRSQLRRLVRLTFYKLLLTVLNENPKPWGILTGVRPLKVIHRLLDSNITGEDLDSYLRKEFYVSKDKIDLAKEVAGTQRKLFEQTNEGRSGINIYIGIPFCPSRCLYCSFPGYEVGKFRKRITNYLDALKREIEEFYSAIEYMDINVDSLYIGGGTPTVLNALQLEDLLSVIYPYVKRYNIREYTLEAGRPDTIDEEKLLLAKNYGVTRVSVNPQTMQEKTLALIGRYHDIFQIHEAAALVQKLNLKLNMDIILGLPEEDKQLFIDSIEKVTDFKPHNITIHALAVKTASKLRELESHRHSANISPISTISPIEVSEIYNAANKILRDKGYKPYYLYRQKRILGDMENIGYSLDGEESWYNVMIMEERQTIIGFGAGAASKFINKDTYNIHGTYYNPKDPIIYGQKENLVEDKINLLCSLFKGEKTWQ